MRAAGLLLLAAMASSAAVAQEPPAESPALAPPPVPAPPPVRPMSPGSPGFTQDQEFTNARLWLRDTGGWTVSETWSGAFGVPRALAGTSFSNDQLFSTAIAYGILPHLELDVAGNVELNQSPTGSYQVAPEGLSGVSAELRIGIGSVWDQIWANPVVDLELDGRFAEPTRLQGRLLFGGELFDPRVLGTLNLMFARDSFRDDTIGIDYQIEAMVGVNGELIPDILRLGVEGTFGWDSHNQIDAYGDTQIYPVAQLGPEVLLTDPCKRVKLLGAFLWGLAPWDAPWTAQVTVGSSF